MRVQPPIVASTVIRASFVFCANDSISIFVGIRNYLLFLPALGFTMDTAPLTAVPAIAPAAPPAMEDMPITAPPAALPAPELTPPGISQEATSGTKRMI